MSKVNKQKFNLAFEKIKEKYREVDTLPRSSSQNIEIRFTKEVIIKNEYKKTKIIIKRPNIKKKKTKSLSREKYKGKKYSSYQKRIEYEYTINITNYKNISLTSTKNKNNKYAEMAKNKLLSLYNKKDAKEKKNKILFLTNIINKMHMKTLKEKYANKMRTILNYYSKKDKDKTDKNEIHKSHKSSKKHSDSSSSDAKNKSKVKIGDYNSNYKKRKNHKSTNIIYRNNSSKRDSFGNIKIVNKMDVKQLCSSEDENNNENYTNSKRNLSKDNNNKDNEEKGGFLDTLKKIKSQIQASTKKKSNEKMNYMNYISNEKFHYNNNYENDDLLEDNNNNNFFRQNSQNQNNNDFNNYIQKTSRPIISNEKEEIFNKYISDNSKKKKSITNITKGNSFNDTESDNNIIIKQTSPIYIHYNGSQLENDEKDLKNNKNYINNINITYNNIINSKNSQNNQAVNNTEKNKRFTPTNNNSNNINIMDLISPVKEGEQVIKNKIYFNPDKNLDKKIKICQIQNKISEIEKLFKNYKKNLPKGNINIKNYKNSIPKSNSKKTKNKDVNNLLNNKIEVDSFSYMKDNIIDGENDQNQNNKKQSILFDESNYDSFYNYKNISLDRANDEKDKKELQIKTLTEDSNINNDNTNRYDMNNSTHIDRKEESNAYHKNDISSDLNINIDLKNQINTLDEDDFDHEKEKNTKIVNNNKYMSDKNNNEIIQRSEEFFYPVKSNDLIDYNNNNNSLNNNISGSENSLDTEKVKSKVTEDLSNKYFEYKIIDKKRRIINFFPNNKNNKAIKVKIPLESYLFIIKKIIHENDENDGEDEVKEDKKDIVVKPISIRFFQNFIRKLIEEINSENEPKESGGNSYGLNIRKNNIFLNIQRFDDKIKSFKKYIIYLLVKKHYLKTEKLKQKFISEKNNSVIEQEKDIYEFFTFLISCISSLKGDNYNNQKKKEYKVMVLDILNNYSKINIRDVAIAQKLYKEGKINRYISINKNKIHKYNISHDNKEKKVFDKTNLKLFMTLSFVVIPLIYIYNYLDSNQKQISLN